MIVYDNIISNLQRTGGISIVFSEMFSRLDPAGIEHLIINFNNQKKTKQKKRILERYRDCIVPKSIAKSDFIFHSTYFRLCNINNARVVTSVYDFTYEKSIGGLRRLVHSTQKNRAIRGSEKIICISESTKKDLLEYLPDVDEDKIEVIYLGVSENFQPILAQQKGKNVIFVGKRGLYKNFIQLVQALSMMHDVGLECVGGGTFTKEELRLLESLIPGRYRHLGYITENELNLAYNRALCLVYPSLYEGFGMPILEAMRAGCPVIATNCSSIPEVAGNAALLLEKSAPDEIKQAIGHVLITENRQTLIEKGLLQAQKFSWDKTFKHTVNVYEQLLGNRLYARS